MLAVVLVTVVLLGVFQPGEGALGEFLKEIPLVGEIHIASRWEIWSKAIEGIQDFAFTGMGMNSFRKVVHGWYPLTTIQPNTDIASAHNHILQAAHGDNDEIALLLSDDLRNVIAATHDGHAVQAKTVLLPVIVHKDNRQQINAGVCSHHDQQRAKQKIKRC